MTEVVQVNNMESKISDNGTSSPAPKTDDESPASEQQQTPNEPSCSDVSKEKLLKTLLSTSTASAATASTTTTAATVTVSSPPVDSMITKEVNDTQLNLTKILYEPDKGDAVKEKDQDAGVVNGVSNGAADTQIVDDDDRLVIDISDDEHKSDGQRKRKKSKSGLKPKSMPLLELTEDSDKSNQMPKVFSYSFDATSLGGGNNVKIDILEPSVPALAIQSNIASSTTTITAEMPRVTPTALLISSTASSKYANLSSLDELNLLSHEIDKQITKKTNEVLELVRDYLSGALGNSSFQMKMLEIGGIAMSDLSLISKKLIKRHKFEPNPNQRDFMRVKQLQFPTSSKDLVNYFEKLLQSITMEQFAKMTKFYEIIIKEMLNLNRTKMLQYLIDFMVIRKNAQLDLLNYNFQTDSSPKIRQSNALTPLSTFEIPDSTQNPKSEFRQWRLRDTSYNFVIRSDPIYVTAGSPMQTKYRDMIKQRMSARIQRVSFQRRPFDNNILKGRRIANRLVSNKEEEKAIVANGNPPNHGNFQHPIQLKVSSTVQKSAIQSARPIALPTAANKDENATIITPIFKSPSIQHSSSPILVESDSPPSTSPPIHKIQKPQILSNHLLHRAFSECIISPSTANHAPQKVAFPSLNSSSSGNKNEVKIERSAPSIRQPLKRPLSHPKIAPFPPVSPMDPLKDGQITLNELKTLNQNGTEIIPTSILKGNGIRSRRKTVDERAQVNGSAIEVKKVVAVAPTSAATISFFPPAQQPTVSSDTQKKIMRRRQSCHERISSVPPSTMANSLGQSFRDFLSDYERKNREEEMRKNQLRQHHQQHLQMHHQQQGMPLYQQPKRVRFTNEPSMEVPRSPQITKSHFAAVAQQHYAQQQQQQQQQQPRSPIEHPRVFQLSQRSPTMRSPSLRSPSKAPPIDYQQHLLFFEREMRERGVDRIEALNDREASRPIEVVSSIQPERYMQHEQQQSMFASPKTARVPEKSPRLQARPTSQMVNDEKIVAYHQLQSLLKDTSAMNLQQYSEHIKQLHLKQQQVNSYQQQQVMDERRESFYQNTQQAVHQQMQQQQQQQQQIKSPTSAQYRSPPATHNEFEQEQQSLQRKLISKSKSSKYIEPNTMASKPFYNPPISTYYSEPFVPTSKKSAPSTPTTPTAFHQPPVSSPQQTSQLYRNLLEATSPMNYQQWVYQQHNAVPSHAQLARPIPRPAIPVQPAPHFSDPKMNALPHHALQTFANQQSDYFRHYFPKSY